MATFLYRMGRTAFRRRWLVALLWAVVLGAVGLGAAKAPAASDDSTSFMPGIEAQKAFDLIGERFPGGDANGANARIVFVAPDGRKVTAAGHRAAIESLVAEAADEPQVVGATSPFTAGAVSKDGSTAYATVDYKVKAADLTDADKAALEKAIDEACDSGLTVEVGGTALTTQPAAGGASEAIGTASGFLGNGVRPEELLSSIRTVAAGDSLLSPTATRALVTRFLATPDTDGFLALPDAVKP